MNFLTKLQNSPEHVKHRWLVGLSAAAMAVVIFLWLSYFNLSVPSPTEPHTEQGGAAEKNSVLKTIGLGARVLATNIKSSIAGFGEILKTPRDYIIKP